MKSWLKGPALDPERGHVADKSGIVHLRRPFRAKETDENRQDLARRIDICQLTSLSRTLSSLPIGSNRAGRRHYECKKIYRRSDRYVLAHFCGMWQCRHCGRLSAGRYRSCRSVPGVRPECRDHGLRHRSHIGLPSQSCRHGRPRRRRALSDQPDPALRDCAGDRRRGCRDGALRDRERRGRLRRQQAVLRPTATASIRPANTA